MDTERIRAIMAANPDNLVMLGRNLLQHEMAYSEGMRGEILRAIAISFLYDEGNAHHVLTYLRLECEREERRVRR
jgi:hypothetical protein